MVRNFPFLPMLAFIKNVVCGGYSLRSYSQEGEDIVLNRFFERKPKNGFFVDVGAHHPYRFSNTYFFYKRGWRGINIDATPGSMWLFNKLRPRDINIEVAISDNDGEMPYYLFKEPALNTFSKDLAEKYIEGGNLLEKQVVVKQTPLSEVLEKHLRAGVEIDFMSVDTEELDLQVLKSSDWDKYRPAMVLVESLDFDPESPGKSEVYVFMSGIGYKLVAKTMNTLFFKIAD